MKLKEKAIRISAAVICVIITVCAMSVSVSAGGWDVFNNATVDIFLKTEDEPMLDENGEPCLDENGNIIYEGIPTFADENGIPVFEKVDDTTVRLVSDFNDENFYFEFCLSEDINIDLNGHIWYNPYFRVYSEELHSFKIYDSIGGGKLVGTTEAAIDTFLAESIHFTLENIIIEKVDISISCMSESVYTVEIKNCEIYGGDSLYGRLHFDVTSGCPNFVCKIIDSKIQGRCGAESEYAYDRHGVGIVVFDEELPEWILEIENSEIIGGEGAVGGDALYSANKIRAKITDSVLSGGETGGIGIRVAEGSEIEIINSEVGEVEYVKSEETQEPDEPTDPSTPADTSVSVEKDGVKVIAANGVFPEGVEININKITSGDIYDSLKGKLSQSFMAFDITAVKNGVAVQPNGKVTVTFAVPEDYDFNLTEVYYIPENGEPEQLSSVKDSVKRTLTVQLEHFSTYAIAQKTAESPQTGNNSGAAALSISLILGALAIAVAKKHIRYVPKH